MNLRQKTMGIIGLTLILLLVILFSLSRFVLLHSYITLEEQIVYKNVERAVSALARESKELADLAGDWAAWDDTWDFIQNNNEGYIESNLVTPTFVNNRLNLMLYIDKSRHIVYGKAVDLYSRQEIPVSPDIRKFFTTSDFIDHSSEKSSKYGIIRLQEEAILVVSRPIVRSTFEGPIRGTLVMGRLIDKALINLLADTTHLAINAVFIDDSLAGEYSRIYSSISGEENIAILPLDNQIIAGYALIRDIYNKPSIVLRITETRDVYNQGLKSMGNFFVLILCSGIIIGFMTLVMLHREILSPLTYLIESISRIGFSGDLRQRLVVKGRDEIARLAETINYMLEALNVSQTELMESRQRYKYLSYHDSLTGLFNRAYFDNELTRINGDKEFNLPLSIISIDIDGLKIINDTMGHNNGDRMLVAVAEIISAPFRKNDIVARIGGDEFCIVLPNMDEEKAMGKAMEIMQLTEAFNANNPLFPVSISLGVASSKPGSSETVYDIYQRADDSMYHYKLSQTESPKSKIIDIMLAALSERDFIAQGHVARLIEMCKEMANRLGFPEERKRDLILLAKVHDLGKVGIPDDILFKPGKLTHAEYETMKEHSITGYNIASRSKELFHIANLILHHHEHWDGKGYPSGLAGPNIPIECRVLAIIDSYDAMTSSRPYHQGVDSQTALNELQRCAGTQFEPLLVEVFVEFIRERQPEMDV